MSGRAEKLFVPPQTLSPAGAARFLRPFGAGVPEETAREAMRLAAHKLPVKCKFIKKADDAENQAEGGEV